MFREVLTGGKAKSSAVCRADASFHRLSDTPDPVHTTPAPLLTPPPPPGLTPPAAFDFLLILLSFVTALALSQVLTSAVRMVVERRPVRQTIGEQLD